MMTKLVFENEPINKLVNEKELMMLSMMDFGTQWTREESIKF